MASEFVRYAALNLTEDTSIAESIEIPSGIVAQI